LLKKVFVKVLLTYVMLQDYVMNIKRSVELLLTSSIIPYNKDLYAHTGPLTILGPQSPHHLNLWLPVATTRQPTS